MTEEEQNGFNHIASVGYVKNSLKMTIPRLEIIVTYLKNTEAQLIGVVTSSVD